MTLNELIAETLRARGISEEQIKATQQTADLTCPSLTSSAREEIPEAWLPVYRHMIQGYLRLSEAEKAAIFKAALENEQQLAKGN